MSALTEAYQQASGQADKYKAQRDDLQAVLDLICSCASQEWQEESGKRMGATDNSGKRLWFIGADIMKEAKEILAKVEKSL